MERKPLRPIAENGKAITVQQSGCRVALIVWRKNGAPVTPLELSKAEALELAEMLRAAAA
jgi:hypothetical protein